MSGFDDSDIICLDNNFSVREGAQIADISNLEASLLVASGLKIENIALSDNKVLQTHKTFD